MGHSEYSITRSPWFRLTLGAGITLLLSATVMLALPRLTAARRANATLAPSARPGLDVVPNAADGYTVVGFSWPANAEVTLQLVPPGDRPLVALPGAQSDGSGGFRTEVLLAQEFAQSDNLRLLARSGSSVVIVPVPQRPSVARSATPMAFATPRETSTPDVGTPTIAPTAVPSNPVCHVVADELNLREGPGTSYPVLVQLALGDSVQPIARDPEGLWVQVVISSGAQGWLAVEWLDCPNLDLIALPIGPGTVDDTPTPGASSPTAVAIQQWRGEYYDNAELRGPPALVRDDARIRFDWGDGSPAAGIAGDGFSARWTRQQHFETGSYRFDLRVDDGARLWVDDTLLVDQWRAANATYVAEIHLSGGDHALRLEYMEVAGRAHVVLEWQRIEAPAGQWRGEYYGNERLGGTPALVRQDAAISFDWGYDSPAPGLPAERFSARWVRQVRFDEGTYRFQVEADDGVRLWVAGNLIIDHWVAGSAISSATQKIRKGDHEVVVEYFELEGIANVALAWEKVEKRPTPTVEPAITEWRGEYFKGVDMSAAPRLVRNERELAFNWKGGSPSGEIPKDRFAARFTRQLALPAGLYELLAAADDGVRVYLDGELLIDDWHVGGLRERTRRVVLDEGNHDLRIEYFEERGTAALYFRCERVGTLTPTAMQPTPTATGLPPTATPTATDVPASATPTATRTAAQPTLTFTPVPPTPTVTATARDIAFHTVAEGTRGCDRLATDAFVAIDSRAEWDSLAALFPLGPQPLRDLLWDRDIVLGVFSSASGGSEITHVTFTEGVIEVTIESQRPSPKRRQPSRCYQLVALSRSDLPERPSIEVRFVDSSGYLLGHDMLGLAVSVDASHR